MSRGPYRRSTDRTPDRPSVGVGSGHRQEDLTAYRVSLGDKGSLRDQERVGRALALAMADQWWQS